MSKQLTLGVTLRDDATFSNFYVGCNEHVIHHLRELLESPREHFMYLYGNEGVGVSHLLQAVCHSAFAQHLNAIYLSLSDPQLTPEVLQDLEAIDVVCLDDLESVLGQPQWEESLLHLYNRVREQGTRLLMGARHKPAALQCSLLDLKSRLSWGLVLAITHLSNQEKGLALGLRAAQRGLQLPGAVTQYLLRHYAQNMTALFQALDHLDAASLSEKRRLSVPFVKQVLATL